MFNIGITEIIIILVVLLIVVGPSQLPKVAKTIGRGMREIRRATDQVKGSVTEIEQEFRDAIDEEDEEAEQPAKESDEASSEEGEAYATATLPSLVDQEETEPISVVADGERQHPPADDAHSWVDMDEDKAPVAPAAPAPNPYKVIAPRPLSDLNTPYEVQPRPALAVKPESEDAPNDKSSRPDKPLAG